VQAAGALGRPAPRALGPTQKLTSRTDFKKGAKKRGKYFLAQEEAPVRQVILDARAIPEIDVTAAERFRTFVNQLHARGITFVVAKAHLPLREAAIRLGLQEWFSEQAHFSQLADAVAAFAEHAAQHNAGLPPKLK
jgi:MFS superfamily sulfate permease-like transporter